MKAQSKEARRSSKSRAEASPHQLSSPYYGRSVQRRNRAHRRAAGRGAAGMRNATVDLLRELPAAAGKQSGRRFGPAPEKPRGPGSGPLPNSKRLDNYDSQNRYQFVLTVRQERQLDRMATRAVHGRRAANRAVREAVAR